MSEPFSPFLTPSTSTPSSLSPSNRAVVSLDDKALVSLVEQLLRRAGVEDAEIARRMGIKPQSLVQYKYGYRHNPSVKWLIRLATICGARLVVEWPHGGI